jgi:hypothetical protein
MKKINFNLYDTDNQYYINAKYITSCIINDEKCRFVFDCNNELHIS